MKKNTLSFKDMFVYGWRKWKVCVVVALLFAVVLGGRQFLNLQRSAQAVVKTDSAGENTTADTEAMSAGVNTEKTDVEVRADFNQNADMLLKMAEKKSDYLNHSIFAGLDPYNEGVAMVDLTVHTSALQEEAAGDVTVVNVNSEEYNSSTGDVIETKEAVAISPAEIEAAEIVRKYTQYILYEMDWTELAKKYETSAKYLQEIVDIEAGNTPNVAVITVYNNDEDAAMDILNYIVEQVKQYSESVRSELTDHELLFDNQVSSTIVDSNMFRFLNVRAGEINSLLTTLNSLKTATSNLSTTSAIAGDTPVGISPKAVLKGTIKHAAVGFVGGIILYFVLVILYLLLSGIVISAKQMNELYDLTKIAVISDRKGKKRGPIERILFAEELAYCTGSSVSDGMKIAAENLRDFVVDQTIAVVGDISSKKMQELKCEMVKHGISEDHVKILANLNDSADEISELKKSAGVVVVAETNQSRYREIEQLLDEIGLHEKKVLGSIVFA